MTVILRPRLKLMKTLMEPPYQANHIFNATLRKLGVRSKSTTVCCLLDVLDGAYT